MPYWQPFYHLVWSTKHRQPLITPDVEPIVYDLLRTKAIGLGATVFAIGGMPDHVHIVAAIPPKIAVAKFVGQIKAVASTKFNKMDHGHILYWQDEYGAFSFDGKRLANVIAYVRRQKEHHTRQTIIPVLERQTGESQWLLREPAPTYAIDDATWRSELLSLEG
jgi:REP element-mobilizing transposase RayT